MKKNTNYWAIVLAIVSVVLLTVCGILYSTIDDMADLDQIKSDEISVLVSQLEDLESEILATEMELETALEDDVVDDELIASLEEELAGLEAEAEEVEDEIIGYIEDELALGSDFSTSVSDKRLDTLFDGEVDFDGDDYDAEETFVLSGLVDINGNDYAENVYVVLEEGDIVYTYTFEDSLNTSLITSEETLEFNLLGQAVTISEWDDDEITFTTGDEYIINQGENITIDEQIILLKIVGEDYVYIEVDGEFEKIDEETTEEVGELEIYVDFVAEGELASLTIASDVEETINDGDDYEDDSIWVWSISNTAISLVLNEDFDTIDDDEDYKSLNIGDGICLPNDYVCVNFDGLSEEDTEDYQFEIDGDFVEIKGLFMYGLNDYEEVYANASGFYDEDEVLIVDNTGVLVLEDTDLELSISGTDLILDDITIALALDAISVDGDSIASEEDNYRTVYGIVVENPEDNIDDNEVSLIIPEEALEASVTIY